MHNSERHLRLVPQETEDQPEAQEQDAPEYSPDDLDGIDSAAAAASEVIVQAIDSNRTNREVVETSEGLRGYVHDTFSGGTLEGLFEGSTLRRVNLLLSDGEGQRELSIVDPESAHPQLLLDGQHVNPEDVPSAMAVIDAVRDERSAQQEQPVVSEEAADPEDELPRAA